MDDSIRILFVEDVRTDAELEVRELRRSGMKVQHQLVETEVDFLQAIDSFAPHVILSDFSMPQFDGMAALAIAREKCPLVPFIFVSGTLGEEYAIRALQQGAADYVLKTNLIRLPAAVTRALRETAERAARRAVEEELAAAHQRMQEILESLDDVVWSRSIADRRLYYLGPAVISIFGRVPEEFIDNPELWWTSVDARDREAVGLAYQRIFEDGTAFDLEYRVEQPGGEIRWVNDRGRSIAGLDGRPERVDGILRDITDRVLERQRIARLTRIRDLSSAVNSAIVRLREPEQLFEGICRIAIEIGEFQAARFVTFDSTGQIGILAAAQGGDIPAFTRALAAYNLNTTRSSNILAESIRTRRPAYKEWSTGAQDEHSHMPGRASASLPFLVKDACVGALVLESVGQDVFDEDERQLLQDLANNISFALELSKQQEQIDYLAYYDVLTGLPNRKLFNDRLAQAITAARREGELLALVIYNVTRLRGINELHGEAAGDFVLRQIGDRLVHASGDAARVARIGGDQFALMIPGIRDVVEAGQILAERFNDLWVLPVTYESKSIGFSAKAGVALFPSDGQDADALFHNAESTLDQARKSADGERVVFYAPEVNARVSERLEIENRLRRAIENREFELHYQPKLELHSKRTVGLEALIRWADPQKGLISPAAFVPILEETGLILEVGRWAMEEAVAQHQRWVDQGMQAPRIAVNISALQLRHKDFVAQIAAILGKRAGTVGLDMEITESMLMENVDEGVEKLRKIREMGVHISIDDFGTGYSSLAYISRLPVNILKIDRSFISGMTDDPDKTSIVSTIIALGHGLRMEVVAEGVETEAQANLLRLLRCDQIQGYLISAPKPAGEIEAYLNAPSA